MNAEHRCGGTGNMGWFLQQMDPVVAPIAERYQGWPATTIRLQLRRSWRAAFGSDLDETVLADCAEAIRDRRPWAPTLWRGVW